MPERLNVVAAVLARWSQDIPAGEDVFAGIAADRAMWEAHRQAATTVSCGGIAELPLYGVITQWCLADAFRSLAGSWVARCSFPNTPTPSRRRAT